MEQANIINWERRGEIGILSMSNGKKNYIDTPDFISLDNLQEWTSEKNLKGIIITGIGRNFSAGADLDKLQDLAQDQNLLISKMNEGKKILDFIEDLEIPVVSAIKGVCFGGGLEIALASHIRVATENALFAFPETNHGLIPGLGGTYRLFKLVGNKSYEIILSADMINAETANQIGLVNHISNSNDALELAEEKLQSMIKDRPIEVIRSVMQAIKNGETLSREEALKAETELFCKLAIKVNFHQQG